MHAIVAGNVYGGGAGVESYKDADGNFKDFPNIGAVDKTTSVTIDGTPSGTVIFGKVYGGGDIADVKNSANVEDADATAAASTVLIQGGCVYQQVFAGGSGRIASECKDYTSLGKVYGNTKVTIQANPTNSPANDPWLWNRVYGGGSYGSVAKNVSDNGGNTFVNITGGHLGYNIFGAGLGDVRTINDAESITSSNVAGNTNVSITGGEWCLSQMWNLETKNWEEATGGTSAQFDDDLKKFKINHNIYGGGNAASNVAGIANVKMTKGLLLSTTALGRDGTDLFSETEWKSIYEKSGSFHFSVIGGGYGEHTVVDSTRVILNIGEDWEETAITASDSESETDKLKTDLSGAFKTAQSVLDVIGGGYNGRVNKGTYVLLDGNPYLRRAYGGSFYANVDNTKMEIKAANVDDIYGGCMMGDVAKRAILKIGEDAADANSRIFVNHNIFGGNDVSGQINGLITVDIRGGKIYNNVYGAGNGNYLYRLNEDRQKVTTLEDFVSDGKTYALLYDVPRRAELMPASAESSSEAARMVNINSFRPLSQYIDLSIAGVAGSPAMSGAGGETARVKVLGKIFGGGNTATVTKLDGNAPTVTVNIGNYVKANEVYMGSDGDAMFDESANSFLADFIRLNNVQLANGINWVNDPYNKAIPEKYLPLTQSQRQTTFPHIIDLYFQPVEMSVQPTLKWNGKNANINTYDGSALTETTIGSFFCGGNRGNMDVTPGNDGNVINYIFPSGLTIKDKIVGGCNNANYINTDLGLEHMGGYLLGKRATTEAMIKLKVADGCNIKPYSVGDTYAGGNIYGGCYTSGTISGDIHIDVHTNMLKTLEVDKLAATDAAGVSAGCIYGAGYGVDSYVYGNVEVALGTSTQTCSPATAGGEEQNSLNISLSGAGNNKTTDVTPVTFDDTGSAANSIYGGGERGKVIGNTVVKILNGHVAGDVCGGSYAGEQYGSTHVFVGYPDYYEVKKSGYYLIKRADKASDNNLLRNYDDSKVIKDTIRLVKGDFIAPCVYDSIYAVSTPATPTAQDITASKSTYFEERHTAIESGNWSNVNILIDEGVYGGGYELTSGYTGTGGVGSYTVKKYTSENNVNNSELLETTDPLYNKTAGAGGNTTVLVWEDDYATTGATHEHITISQESAEGGLYGDGHLSYSEGFRAGELKGYGYANHTVLEADAYNNQTKPNSTCPLEVDNAKVMNTIQRLDIMRLTDNCLLLNGARDYTINEVSTTPYSVAGSADRRQYGSSGRP